MKEIEFFIQHNGEGVSYQSVTHEKIECFQEILPEFLLKIWKEKGLLKFRDSFFWLIDPSDYYQEIGFFIPNTANMYPVLRTAFGGFIFLNNSEEAEKKYNYLCPIFNRLIGLTNRLEAVMNGWLTTEEIYFPLMFPSIYSEARKRLPAPTRKECYGFNSALALGGDLNSKNIQIYNLKTHLEFLSQIR